MNPKLQSIDGHVYGVIYWFAMLDNKKCYLTNAQLAELLKTKNPKSIGNSLNRLEKYKCIKRVFKDASRRVRDEIIPLIKNDEKDVPSENGTGSIKKWNRYHQKMEQVPFSDGHNKRIKEENKKENINCAFSADEEKTEKVIKNENSGFEQFWSAYPRKVNKKNTLKIWIRENCDSVLPKILAFLDVANKSERWSPENMKYIKHPSTFLNGECWEDDLADYPPARIDGKSNVKLPTNGEDYKGFVKK